MSFGMGALLLSAVPIYLMVGFALPDPASGQASP